MLRKDIPPEFLKNLARNQAIAKDYRPGDIVYLREESMGLQWQPEFTRRAGRGPWVILQRGYGGGIQIAHLGSTEPIPHRDGLYMTKPGNWIFGHFFVRNNFLGACHRAITLNPKEKEKHDPI